jgi:restriction endonuclease
MDCKNKGNVFPFSLPRRFNALSPDFGRSRILKNQIGGSNETALCQARAGLQFEAMAKEKKGSWPPYRVNGLSKDSSGRSLEQIVTRIQQILAPGAAISHRERIINRLGVPREFDVVVRGKWAGHPMIGVIECKDWADKVGTPEVDAFVTKSRDINANLRLMVSSKGFTSSALAQAADAGVGVLSLLPNDPNEAGFSIGVLWYARVYRWERLQMLCKFHGQPPPPNSYNEAEVLYLGKPLANWFLKELTTTYCSMAETGPFTLKAKAKTTEPITIHNQQYYISELAVAAVRSCQRMRRYMQITGDAFFDWNAQELRYATDSKIGLEISLPDFGGWLDYDGDIPKAAPYIIDRFMGCIELESAEIPDIRHLLLDRPQGVFSMDGREIPGSP